MKYFYNGELEYNLKVTLNRLGYHAQTKSYVRRLSRSSYPRFHLYVKERENGLEFNLHLDEKRPSYEGQTAHSGQYDSELVHQEMERIKGVLIT